MLVDIIQIRNNYLEKHNKTILDKSPFKEFILKCKGATLSTKRKWLLSVIKKKENNKRPKFLYNPNSKIKPKKYIFKNISGNIIKK